MACQFDEAITDRVRFRELVGREAGPLVNDKTIDHIDPICRRIHCRIAIFDGRIAWR